MLVMLHIIVLHVLLIALVRLVPHKYSNVRGPIVDWEVHIC